MELMNSLENKDYEIDILIGKLGAILIIVRSFHLVWRVIAEGKQFLGLIFLVSDILVPCLYLFSLHRHNVKFSKLTLRIWVFCFLFMCWSVTDKFLNKPSGFWRVILPYAFMTACMIIGQMGVARIKDPEQTPSTIKDPALKIPKSYHNTRVLICSIGTIIGLVSIFTLTVFLGKYLCDFALSHWPTLEKNRVFWFYAGIAISFYPSVLLATAITSVLTVLFGRIWNLCVKHNTGEP
jgi:hypothetical protein